MPPVEPSSNRFGYWRSLGDLANAPEFQEAQRLEFLGGVPDDVKGVSRRRFMQVMSASIALAGATGCRWPKQEILPEVSRPDGFIPGVPRYYATAMELGGVAQPVLAKSIDGRPIKVDGNPDHPLTQTRGGKYATGASGVFAQASTLGLYDPDRLGAVRNNGSPNTPSTWEAFSAYIAGVMGKAKEAGGAKLRVLSEASSSPTLLAQKQAFLAAYPQAKWFEYEALSRDNETAGTKLAFGKAYRPHYALDKAEVIVAIDADLFGSHPAAVTYSRDFAKGRNPDEGKMSRMYSVEANFTSTGSAADNRLPWRASDMLALLLSLEGKVVAGIPNAGFTAAAGAVNLIDGDSYAGKFIAEMASDLLAARGKSVIAVGEGQPPEVHAVAHRLNVALGNMPTCVEYLVPDEADRPSHLEQIKTLTDEMKAGAVDTLVILGGNPVYDAPVDFDFAGALDKVATAIHLTEYRNETSRAKTVAWVLPKASYLESWGDPKAFDGSLCIGQPLIAPLYAGKSAIELVALLIGGEGPKDGLALVQATYKTIVTEGNVDDLWATAVHQGFQPNTRYPSERPTPVAGWNPTVPAEVKRAEAAPELVFIGSPAVYDGRFANLAWLQELPDYITKLVWDNAAFVSKGTAEKLGVSQETLLSIEVDGRTIQLPTYILPGVPLNTIVATLGYGRTAAGRVAGDVEAGVPTVGVNTYAIRSSGASYVAKNVKVSATSAKYTLATTQDHFAIDMLGLSAIHGRLGQLIREEDHDVFSKLNEDEKREHIEHQGAHHPPLKSLWKEWEYEGHKWGMAIDLTKCVGCNACVVACQAENNVPVVGKEQVLKGREMHWMRMDRYFAGDPTKAEISPRIVHQPMSCQQCENAPCEQVCPVAATIHSHEGLNDMVYNRCVGTRYCANNCPYKVRRFNFFSWQAQPLIPGSRKDPVMDVWATSDPRNETLKMVQNPQVTVRNRGVMEKCTYCVQNIQAVKIKAKNEGRPIEDGEISAACQASCSAGAITFGDLNDANSAVAKQHANPRAYGVLAELNVKPRTNYLARINNPNKELARLAGNLKETHGAAGHGAAPHAAPAGAGDHSHG